MCADGLAGHEWDFYRYTRHSSWTQGGRGGGWEYSGLRESATYWFNYIVPLAYALDDARLKAQAAEFVEMVLSGQHEDGWLGPEKLPVERGLWARSFLIGALQVGLTLEVGDETDGRSRIRRQSRRWQRGLLPPFTGLWI